jgi:DNA-binding HxlR family transcriptional regulator
MARMERRSQCPIACALDLAGDRWTLLVVRDLLRGRRTYGELAASAEGIPTNLLADRLLRLEEAGLVEAVPYQARPVRYAYALTQKGRGLEEVLGALARWGKRHIPGTRVFPEFRAPARGSPRSSKRVRDSGKST